VLVFTAADVITISGESSTVTSTRLRVLRRPQLRLFAVILHSSNNIRLDNCTLVDVVYCRCVKTFHGVVLIQDLYFYVNCTRTSWSEAGMLFMYTKYLGLHLTLIFTAAWGY